MNHYFTINYSFLLPEKVLCTIKAITLLINILKISISLIQHFWQLSIQKYYITNSLTIVLKQNR